MKIQWNTSRALLTLAALLIFAVALFAQATDSIIVGTVTDSSGSAVPNAKVTVTNKDTNVKYEVTANNAGQYRANNIPTAGRYDVSATAPGFANATVADVHL